MTVLHVTNGDSAEPGIRAAESTGDVLPWRDILHEGPVPPALSLHALSQVRAEFLAREEMGSFTELTKNFADRDNMLARFADYDEVTLWFEWDLYDQLQLIQVLDFLAGHSDEALRDSRTKLSLVCIAGYLGPMPIGQFEGLYAARKPVTREMLDLARRAWAAFRSPDPRHVEEIIRGDTVALEFLAAALTRQLQELPSVGNGLSRSEQQVLEVVEQRPLTFGEIFKRTSDREDRLFCGDDTMARYIERMSRHNFPLLLHPTGEPVVAPRTDAESRAFRNAEIALTRMGSDVLRGNRDWISLGGTDRWAGGVHLQGSESEWRWDGDSGRVVDVTSAP